MNAFASIDGTSSLYNSGSYVDVKEYSMLTGLDLGSDLDLERLTLGTFIESGMGNYNSHNSFSHFSSVNGDGETSYTGIDSLGRYDITQGALDGLYFDASA